MIMPPIHKSNQKSSLAQLHMMTNEREYEIKTIHTMLKCCSNISLGNKMIFFMNNTEEERWKTLYRDHKLDSVTFLDIVFQFVQVEPLLSLTTSLPHIY